MLASIKSEFRKLLTVRSTYFITAIALLLIGFISFYAMGMQAGEAVKNPKYLTGVILDSVNFATAFISIVALLLLAHEYRYNTIMYSLTSSSSRNKFLIAKIVAATGYAFMLVLLVGVLAPLLASLGASVKHLDVVPQTLQYGDLLWRILFAGFANAMVGLLFIALIRNQIGALVAVFLIPTTGETLLTLLIKEKSIYLPFSALNEVISTANTRLDSGDSPFVQGHLSPIKGAAVFGIYLVIGWIVAWILFLKRDAN